MAGFVNQRAIDMWSQIDEQVDFIDKSVVDVGCGAGDFIRLALGSGAKYVTGIDLDYAILLDAASAIRGSGWSPKKHYRLQCADIDDLVAENSRLGFSDIVLCFSCLPYLKDFHKSLDWLSKLTKQYAIIECQYYGDGPGLPEIKDDQSMEKALLGYWHSAKKIGETDTVIRDAFRSIWLCEYGAL